MIPLPNTYRKNGYDYRLVERILDVAIFEQTDEGKVIAYEVFEVIKQKEWTAFGKTYPARETIPPTESWGTNAFTVHSLEQARVKAKMIEKRMIERVARQYVFEKVSD